MRLTLELYKYIASDIDKPEPGIEMPNFDDPKSELFHGKGLFMLTEFDAEKGEAN